MPRDHREVFKRPREQSDDHELLELIATWVMQLDAKLNRILDHLGVDDGQEGLDA